MELELDPDLDSPMAQPQPQGQDADLMSQTLNLITHLYAQKHKQPSHQRVTLLVYGTGTLIPTEKATKKNPHPFIPPHEQHVLLHRISQGKYGTPPPGAPSWYLWDLPQLPKDVMDVTKPWPKGVEDVRDDAVVGRVAWEFLDITLKKVKEKEVRGKSAKEKKAKPTKPAKPWSAKLPEFVPMCDEHLLQWTAGIDGDGGQAGSAAGAAGAKEESQSVLVKTKIMTFADLPLVRMEVAGVYKWWPVAEVRAGKPEALSEGDREAALRFSDCEFWLEEYPEMLAEAKTLLEL